MLCGKPVPSPPPYHPKIFWYDRHTSLHNIYTSFFLFHWALLLPVIWYKKLSSNTMVQISALVDIPWHCYPSMGARKAGMNGIIVQISSKFSNIVSSSSVGAGMLYAWPMSVQDHMVYIWPRSFALCQAWITWLISNLDHVMYVWLQLYDLCLIQATCSCIFLTIIHL